MRDWDCPGVGQERPVIPSSLGQLTEMPNTPNLGHRDVALLH